jgi:hypothetical protein
MPDLLLTMTLLALAGAPTPPPAACTYRGTAKELATRVSPLDSSQIRLPGGTIKLCYGRPSVRGRQVMDSLVPYGTPWRLGANEPTRLFLPFAAQVAGVPVRRGAYSLYVVPRATEWDIHVNRAVDRWGIPIDSLVTKQDAGEGTVPVEALSQPVEKLTIRFGPATGGATELVVEWEKTRVRIPIRKTSS